MRGNQHEPSVHERRRDPPLPIRQHTRDRILQALGRRDRDPRIAAIVAQIVRAARFERRRRDVEAAPPDMHLFVAIPRRGLRLVAPGQPTINSPAALASSAPFSVTSTAHEPVKRFSKFHADLPWRIRTRVGIATFLQPFALSLSKGCFYVLTRVGKGRRFDKLGANGGWDDRTADNGL